MTLRLDQPPSEAYPVVARGQLTLSIPGETIHCEHERALRKAAYALRLMRGQEVLDLPHLQGLLEQAGGCGEGS